MYNLQLNESKGSFSISFYVIYQVCTGVRYCYVSLQNYDAFSYWHAFLTDKLSSLKTKIVPKRDYLNV